MIAIAIPFVTLCHSFFDLIVKIFSFCKKAVATDAIMVAGYLCRKDLAGVDIAVNTSCGYDCESCRGLNSSKLDMLFTAWAPNMAVFYNYCAQWISPFCFRGKA